VFFKLHPVKKNGAPQRPSFVDQAHSFHRSDISACGLINPGQAHLPRDRFGQAPLRPPDS